MTPEAPVIATMIRLRALAKMSRFTAFMSDQGARAPARLNARPLCRMRSEPAIGNPPQGSQGRVLRGTDAAANRLIAAADKARTGRGGDDRQHRYPGTTGSASLGQISHARRGGAR